MSHHYWHRGEVNELNQALTALTQEKPARDSLADLSIANSIVVILKETNRPLKINEIAENLVRSGKKVDIQTVRGVIYNRFNAVKLFKRVSIGIFGLLRINKIK